MNDTIQPQDNSSDTDDLGGQIQIPNNYPYNQPYVYVDGEEKDPIYYERQKDLAQEGVLDAIWQDLRAIKDDTLFDLQEELDDIMWEYDSHMGGLPEGVFKYESTVELDDLQQRSKDRVEELKPEIRRLEMKIRDIDSNKKKQEKLKAELDIAFEDHIIRMRTHYQYYNDLAERTNIVDFTQTLIDKLTILLPRDRFFTPYITAYIAPYDVEFPASSAIAFLISKKKWFTDQVNSFFSTTEALFSSPGNIRTGGFGYVNEKATSPNPFGNFSILNEIFATTIFVSEKKEAILKAFLAQAVPGETIYVPKMLSLNLEEDLFREFEPEEWEDLELRIKTPDGMWLTLGELNVR